jgi:hypothetical protein
VLSFYCCIALQVGFNMRKVTKGGVTIKMWDLGGQVGCCKRGFWELQKSMHAAECASAAATLQQKHTGCHM